MRNCLYLFASLLWCSISGIFAASCPGDSYFNSLANLCQCLPCPGKPVCESKGHVELVFPGKGVPGRCCDDYVCIPPTGRRQTDGLNHNSDPAVEDCAKIVCPIFPANISCPDDSARVSAQRPVGSCCALPSRCECKECNAPLLCSHGYKRSLLRAANRTIPGSCCDSVICTLPEREPSMIRYNSQRELLNRLNCVYNGQEYTDGDMWTASDVCTECNCRNGIALCKDVQCPVLKCEAPVERNGQCCLVCEDCISSSGAFHKNFESWKEDDCTTCSCLDGNTECQVEECRFSCPESESVKAPGQCCPTCNETQEYSSIVMPAHCPSVDKCALRCQHGYVKNVLDGCFRCECKIENCSLACEFGYKADPVTGEGRCSCLQNSLEIQHASGTCSPVTHCAPGCVLEETTGKCPLCKCAKCPEFRIEKCAKECRDGYVAIDGCLSCLCLEGDVTDSIDVDELSASITETSVSPAMPISCEDSSMEMELIPWNEGCHECVCYARKKMCDLPRACSSAKNGDSSTCCEGRLGVETISLQCKTSSDAVFKPEPFILPNNCSECICSGSVVYCSKPDCPALACGSDFTPNAGQCCPSCKAIPKWQTDGRAKVKCAKDHIVHESGDVWWESSCKACGCFDGALKCSTVECPKLDCGEQHMRFGSCCPVCANSSNSVTKEVMCQMSGNSYVDGDIWDENCRSCTCNSGKVDCLQVECSLHCTEDGESACCKNCTNDSGNEPDGLSTPLGDNGETHLPQVWIPLIVFGTLLALGLGIYAFIRVRRQKLNSYGGKKYELCSIKEKQTASATDRRKKESAEHQIFIKHKP